MTLILGLLIIAAAVSAVIQKVDVRLALLLAAFTLGGVGRDVPAIAQKSFSTFAAPEYLIPICSAMGFAYALRDTHGDQHLVHLLAVTLMCASLTGTTPPQLAKRVAPQLLIGMVAVVIAAIVLAPHAVLPPAK